MFAQNYKILTAIDITVTTHRYRIQTQKPLLKQNPTTFIRTTAVESCKRSPFSRCWQKKNIFSKKKQQQFLDTNAQF